MRRTPFRSARLFSPAAAVAAALVCNLPAPVEETTPRGADTRGVPSACPGDRIRADRVVTGELSSAEQGSYVLVPFDVPRGTTAVRVKYCYDQPERPTLPQARHTLDLGLYGPREAGGVWGPREFRGWGGSSHPDVTVSAQGFSSEAQYLDDPKGHVPGRTTRGFSPGPIEPGEWAAELGVAGVVTRDLGDADGRVAYRVEIELARDRRFLEDPYEPAPYDPGPVRRGAGWYAGDLHVHGEHSALGDAPMTEVVDYAFRPVSEGGAGLDFLQLSDYVVGSAWGEIGRVQDRHPRHLVGRSAEVITYRGHTNNHASGRVVDYRTGPLLERRADGSLRRLRGPRPPDAIFRDVRAAGGYTQINHPTIFPSQIPLFALFCRGCPWDYSAAEGDPRLVDAIEVSTGPPGLRTTGDPGPNPFTPLAIGFYERMLGTPGAHIAAVGVSDSHNAGRTNDPVTQAPIGTATTMVYADELSESGVQRAVERGHTYVKVFGSDGPDLRFEARDPARPDRPAAIFGDTLDAAEGRFTVRVTGATSQHQLVVVHDGSTLATVPVTGPDFTYEFTARERGRYRLQLVRGQTIDAIGTPIWLGPREPLATSLAARRRSFRVRRHRLEVPCRVTGTDARACAVRLVARPRGARPRIVGFGEAPVTSGIARARVRLTRQGRRLFRERGGRGLRVVANLAGRDREGRERLVRRGIVLRPARR